MFANFHDCPEKVHQGKVASTLPPRLAHLRSINTYGGHLVACAVGLRNIEIVEREGLVERAAEMGAFLKQSLEDAIGAHKHVGEVRGRGLLVGVELVADRDTKTPLDDGCVRRRRAGAARTPASSSAAMPSTVPASATSSSWRRPSSSRSVECARVADIAWAFFFSTPNYHDPREGKPRVLHAAHSRLLCRILFPCGLQRARIPRPSMSGPPFPRSARRFPTLACARICPISGSACSTAHLGFGSIRMPVRLAVTYWRRRR